MVREKKEKKPGRREGGGLLSRFGIGKKKLIPSKNLIKDKDISDINEYFQLVERKYFPMLQKQQEINFEEDDKNIFLKFNYYSPSIFEYGKNMKIKYISDSDNDDSLKFKINMKNRDNNRDEEPDPVDLNEAQYSEIIDLVSNRLETLRKENEDKEKIITKISNLVQGFYETDKLDHANRVLINQENRLNFKILRFSRDETRGITYFIYKRNSERAQKIEDIYNSTLEDHE